MTTLTIKINERTKAGKTLMNLIELFSKEQKGILIIDEQKTEDQEKFPAVSQEKLKPHVLKSFEETDSGIGLSEPQSEEDFLKEIETW